MRPTVVVQIHSKYRDLLQPISIRMMTSQSYRTIGTLWTRSMRHAVSSLGGAPDNEEYRRRVVVASKRAGRETSMAMTDKPGGVGGGNAPSARMFPDARGAVA